MRTRRKSHAHAPLGVIDIGSNSVRLVIYTIEARFPVPLVNDKVMCGLGRSLGATGLLHEDGVMRAIAAMRRFRALARATGVSRLAAVATAAVRDARNGTEFVTLAEKTLGASIRIISGEEEAALVAQGVLFGNSYAEGLAGDLGGGSLELVELGEEGVGNAITLPIGPLRLMDASGGSMSKVAELVDEALEVASWLGALDGQPLYAVGGIWRSFAKLVMAGSGYPLSVLHQYRISAKQVRRFTTLIAKQSPSSLSRMVGMSPRRIDAMPYGAIVLDRVTRAAGLGGVIVSAYGLREGVLMRELNRQRTNCDPLLDAARDMRDARSRSPAMVDELLSWLVNFNWLSSGRGTRLREAAALLSDIVWQAHPDYRAEDGFITVLTSHIAGLDHADRTFLALTLWHRHGGAGMPPDSRAVKRLLTEDERETARRLGYTMRVAYRLCGAAPGILPRCPLSMENGTIVLDIPKPLADLSGEGVLRRLTALAQAMDLKADIRIA